MVSVQSSYKRLFTSVVYVKAEITSRKIHITNQHSKTKFMDSIYFTVLAFLKKTKNEYYIYKVYTLLWQKCCQRYPNYSFFVKLTFRTTSVSINGVVYVISDAGKYCLLSAAYHPPNSNVYPKNVDVIFTLRSRSHLNLFFFSLRIYLLLNNPTCL